MLAMIAEAFRRRFPVQQRVELVQVYGTWLHNMRPNSVQRWIFPGSADRHRRHIVDLWQILQHPWQPYCNGFLVTMPKSIWATEFRSAEVLGEEGAMAWPESSEERQSSEVRQTCNSVDRVALYATRPRLPCCSQVLVPRLELACSRVCSEEARSAAPRPL